MLRPGRAAQPHELESEIGSLLERSPFCATRSLNLLRRDGERDKKRKRTRVRERDDRNLREKEKKESDGGIEGCVQVSIGLRRERRESV